MSNDDRVVVWEAINKYAAARRGDMARMSCEIEHAVVEVENVIERIVIRRRHEPEEPQSGLVCDRGCPGVRVVPTNSIDITTTGHTDVLCATCKAPMVVLP